MGRFCPNCGKESAREDEIFCSNCGNNLNETYQAQPIQNDNIVYQYEQKNGVVTKDIAKSESQKKKEEKIILTITFTFIGLVLLISILYGISLKFNDKDKNQKEDTSVETTTPKNKVKVVDFSSMSTEEINKWCSDNKISCNTTNEYSDNVESGKFISQSVAPEQEIKEGQSIRIVYSLGKKPTMGERNALESAKIYSRELHMSKKAIYNQLTSEISGFTAEEAQYAVDNLNADYKQNALESAKIYSRELHMSKKAIYNQLTSEISGFTAEEAQYAIDHLED